MIVVALHGFLGTPDDWDSAFSVLDETAQETDDGFDVVTPDLAVWATRSNVTDFESFAKEFNRQVSEFAEKKRDDQIVIAGYSLGARLAGFCLIDEPELYRGALLLSMNPGLLASDSNGRRERFAADLKWADRLRREPWDDVLNAWNAQPVLQPGSRAAISAGGIGHQSDVARRKLEGRRQAWARAMEVWSLGHQTDLRRDLLDWASGTLGGIGHAPVRPRLTLMTGTEDAKFSDLTAGWLTTPGAGGGIGHDHYVRHRHVLGAGHRILLEAPEDVASELKSLTSESL